MNSFFINNKLINLDYLFFGVGFAFIVLGITLFIFIKRKNFNETDGHFLFFNIYVVLIGIAAWNDFLLLVFPDYHNYEIIRYIIFSLSYISLFEFGRRELFTNGIKGKVFKYDILLYLIPIIILIKFSVAYSLLFIAIMAMFMSSHGMFVRLKREELLFKIDVARLILLNLLAFTLIFLFVFRAINPEILMEPKFHILKYLVEWTFAIIISFIFLKNILHVLNREPLEYQLKSLKMRVFNSALILIVIIYLFGLILVNYLGERQWEEEKENLIHDINIAAISLEANDYIEIYGTQYIDSMQYDKINLKLEQIKEQFNYAENVYTIFYKDNKLVYSVNLLKQWDFNNNYGNFIEKTVILNNVIKTGEPALEITDDNIITFAPIKDSEGNIVTILAVEVLEEPIIKNVQYERLRGIMLIFIFLLIIIGVSGIYYISKRETAWKTNHIKILSSIGDMVGIFDKKGKILYANNAAYDLTGYSIDSHEVSIYDFVDLKEKNKLNNLIKSLEKDKINYSELIIKTSIGKDIPVYGSISYLDYEHSDSLYVFTAVDISEQKRREEDIQIHFKNTLSLLAMVVDAKDKYTAKHSINVAKYAKAIAKELDMSAEKIKEVETAAFIHDIGKVGIPDNILKKEGPLTDKEWSIMRKHPEYGKRILEKSGDTFNRLIPYVYYHHERYDGKGYPEGLVIPTLEISIISVADTLDAMTSDRAYRKGLDIEIAKAELIKGSSTQFHPQVVEALLNILKRNNNFISNEHDLTELERMRII